MEAVPNVPLTGARQETDRDDDGDAEKYAVPVEAASVRVRENAAEQPAGGRPADETGSSCVEQRESRSGCNESPPERPVVYWLAR